MKRYLQVCLFTPDNPPPSSFKKADALVEKALEEHMSRGVNPTDLLTDVDRVSELWKEHRKKMGVSG